MHIRSQRRRICFQASHHRDVAGTDGAETLRDFFILRQDKVERTEKRRRHLGRALPIARRPGGDAGIDQRQLDAARLRRADQVGPEIGFHEQPSFWFPVIQETRHRTWCIERDIMMDGVCGQALCQ